MPGLFDERIPTDWPLLGIALGVGVAILIAAAVLGSGAPAPVPARGTRRWLVPLTSAVGTLATLLLVVRGSFVAAVVIGGATAVHALRTRTGRARRG